MDGEGSWHLLLGIQRFKFNLSFPCPLIAETFAENSFCAINNGAGGVASILSDPRANAALPISRRFPDLILYLRADDVNQHIRWDGSVSKRSRGNQENVLFTNPNYL